MSFKVLITSEFRKDSKRLTKKYKSLKAEIVNLISSLEENPTQGTAIGSACYKIRIAIKSKGKGKSGGGRVITYVKILGKTVYLLSIYSKSEKENITDRELTDLTKRME